MVRIKYCHLSPSLPSFVFMFCSLFSKKSVKTLVYLSYSFYFCRVPVRNGDRHIGKERFEDIIPYWNLDNFMHKDNKQENAHVIVIYLPVGSLYTDWRGLLFITCAGLSRASIR